MKLNKVVPFLLVSLGMMTSLSSYTVLAKDFDDAPKPYLSSSAEDKTLDSLFDDSVVFGTVYVDENENGEQDEGELGLSGVRIVTAKGQVLITDKNGRYHLPDNSGGSWGRGTNFLLQLDEKSLPQGYKVIGSTSVITRLSPGLPSKVDFKLTREK